MVEVTAYGGPEVLRLAPRPTPPATSGQVRVAVAAATVNPADLATREGLFADRLPDLHPPFVLGWEYAGTALDDGDGVRAGDPVVGQVPWFTTGDGRGAYGEIVVCEAAWLCQRPEGLDPVIAATVGLNGLTAAQALDLTGVGDGESLLVTGASGTVGALAVQLAAQAGARVIAAGSAGDETWLGGLGAADVVTDRGPDALAARARAALPDGVDAVLDAACVGGTLIGAVRDDGRFAGVLDPAAPAAERDVQVAVVHTVPDPDRLGDLVQRLAQGRLVSRVADTVPLADAARAHERAAGGGLRGKLVLIPDAG